MLDDGTAQGLLLAKLNGLTRSVADSPGEPGRGGGVAHYVRALI